MSDLCMYELEDIVWDEFGQSDDHIVPHPRCVHTNEHSFQGDSHKKSRREVIGISSDAKGLSQETEKRVFPTQNKRRNKMLEKDPWSHAPDAVFSGSCDSHAVKEVTSLASGSTRMSSDCFQSSNMDSIGSEFCADDSILGERCTAVDSNSYNYPLIRTSQTDNDLSFFENECEDKESSDLLYYGWPDIGNFEDVDGMFRICDSSLWLGVAANEEELGWFSSTDAIEGSEDALKSGFKFSCPDSNALKNRSENYEPSRLNNESSSINDSSMKSASVRQKGSSRPSKDDEHDTLSHLSFMNGSNHISEIKDEFMPKEQMNGHKKQPKLQNQSEGKRKDWSLANDGSFDHMGNLQNKDIQLPSGDFTSGGIRQKKQNLGPDSFGCLQTNIPSMHSDDCHPLNQTTVSPALSGIKSENKGLTSLSPKQYELKKHGDVEGVGIGVVAEIDSSNVQESSSLNSGLDEISQEATSFCQLQQIMEQLDLRTKLCIRNSLYRLAKSAAQRHNHANLNGCSGGDSETCGALMENKCTGFLDMETDTNPIDRSMAHLLFHRPSDSSVKPVPYALSLK